MAKNLEEAIQEAGSPVKLLWEARTPPAVVPRVVQEFTNWRDEQMAWHRTAVLFDQSHHMADLNIKGPDVLGLIGKLAVNSIVRFSVDMAKQFVAVNYDGYVIGDNILLHLEEDEYQAVGIPPSINWLHDHAVTGGYDLRVWRDERIGSLSGPMSAEDPEVGVGRPGGRRVGGAIEAIRHVRAARSASSKGPNPGVRSGKASR